MTNLITLTIPNDDHIALRAFGKALEEMALAHLNDKLSKDGLFCDENGVIHSVFKTPDEVEPEATPTNSSRDDFVPFPQVDTTAQQIESLATNVVDRTVDLPEPTVSDAATDSTGTPWDERIHSASKALNADGTWRLRRKPKDMDEAEWSDYVSMIKADLQYPVECGGEKEESAGGDSEKNEQNSNENNNITPAEVEPPVTPPGDDFHTDADVVTEQTVAGIPPIPVPPPVVVPPVTEECTFPKLMTFLTERQGKIDVATVNMLLAQDGIASLPELNAHPDKIGPFVTRVKAHLGE